MYTEHCLAHEPGGWRVSKKGAKAEGLEGEALSQREAVFLPQSRFEAVQEAHEQKLRAVCGRGKQPRNQNPALR